LLGVALLGIIFTLLQVGARYIPLPYEAASEVKALEIQIQRLSDEVQTLRR